MIGQLATDQQNFVNMVSGATGLAPDVVTAWVGTESGWGVAKSDHNYLNIGPGRQYSSVNQAAAATADLINTSSNYAGIRSAIPQGPSAQIAAIGSSPWGTSASTLQTVAADMKIPDQVPFIGGATVGNPLNIPKDIASAISSAANTAVSGFAKAGLSLVFVAGAIGLIGLGIARLTAKPASDLVDSLQNATGVAGGVGAVLK